MLEKKKFYINGKWTDPFISNHCNVIDPSRYLLTQKMETYKYIKSQDNPIFMADQTKAQSNYGRVK